MQLILQKFLMKDENHQTHILPSWKLFPFDSIAVKFIAITLQHFPLTTKFRLPLSSLNDSIGYKPEYFHKGSSPHWGILYYTVETL